MNSTSDSYGSGRESGQDTAVGCAEAGTAGWEDAVRLQRWATANHADFYALAGEMVSTLCALDDLAHVLHRQVTGYGQGRRLYDDTRQVDSAARLVDAATELGGLIAYLQAAQSPANRFWSAVGHIGVETTDPCEPDPSGTDPCGPGSVDTNPSGPCGGGEVSS